MTSSASPTFRRALCVAALLLVGRGALAAPGQGQGHQKDKAKDKDKSKAQAEPKVGGYFRDDQRQAAVQYYGQWPKSGRCPPGLAKKNNGCRPPGQARKWQLGQALPPDVRWYPVPPAVVVTIGSPPPGYRYVRVLNDILLIAIGTRMVIDAIEDLMR